jgi:hypothetical protein
MQYNIINVKATKEYNICIGRGVLSAIGELIAPVLGKCRLAVLTDSNVDALYGGTMMEYLAAAGYDACKYVIPAGEASKCADNLLAFLNFLAQEQFTRSDAILLLVVAWSAILAVCLHRSICAVSNIYRYPQRYLLLLTARWVARLPSTFLPARTLWAVSTNPLWFAVTQH